MDRRHLSFCALLCFLWLFPAPASGADLTRIDRTIAKQPVYQSKPKYGLLVFGPEAKERFWLVLDGETLYADRNGNGDLTDRGESVLGKGKDGAIAYMIPDLVESDGNTKHTCFHLLQTKPGSVSLRVRVGGERFWWAGFRSDEGLFFAERPADAPIIHFDGPRTFGMPRPTALEGTRHSLSIGTPGLGQGTFAALDANQIPKTVRLKAEIEFPSAKPGGEPIRIREEYAFSP
jgi:hypothetical protein